MNWLCLINGNQDAAIKAAKDCDMPIVTLVDRRTEITRSLLNFSSLVVPVSADDYDEVRKEFKKLCDKYGLPRAVISFGSCGEAAVLIASQLSVEYDLPNNHPDVVLRTIDKSKMRECLNNDRDIALPFFKGSADEVAKYISNIAKDDFPVIVKPVDGSGSSRINLIENYQSASSWLKVDAVKNSSQIWIA